MTITILKPDNGFEQVEKTENEIIDFIQTYIATNDGWLMIDGVQTSPSNITLEILTQASVITITNLITGGKQ